MSRRSWHTLALAALALGAAPVAAQTVAAIQAGETLQGNLTANDSKLSDGSYSRFYSYTGSAGERIRVTLRSRSFDAFLMIGPAGNPAASQIVSDDDGGGGTDAQVTYTVPSDGQYSIMVNSRGANSTGTYTVSLESLGGGSGGGSASPVATAIAMGETRVGELSGSDARLNDGSYADYYSFDGRAGQRVRITMRSTAFDSWLVVGVVDGGSFTTLAHDDDSGGGSDAQLTYVLPRDGGYFIRANSVRANTTGGYSLSLESMGTGTPSSGNAATVADAAPILVGQTVQGELTASDAKLSDESYADYYAYEGRAGQRIRVTMRSADFDSYMVFGRLNGTAFSSLASDDDGGGGSDSQITYTLPDNGTYAIRANTLAPGRTGRYSVTLINVGQTFRGTLNSSDMTLSDGSYAEDFVLSGRAGQRITITLRSTEFDTYLKFGRMIGGQYRELAANDDGAGGTDSRLSITLPDDGDYVIRANTLFKDKAGVYTVSVE